MKSKLLLLAAFGLSAVPAIAQELPVAVVRCASVKDEGARLACYDGIAAGLKQAAVVQPAPPAVVAAQPPAVTPAAPPPPVALPPAAPSPVAAKVAEFGADTMRKPEPERGAPAEVDEIKGAVAQVVFSPLNRFTVTLDNGQVWRQIDADTTKARFHKGGDTVTISRGAIGSYNLSIDGHDLVVFKVHRLR